MVLILESRTHLDLGDLPNLLAAELGVMTVRLERAIRSLDGVARVHVNRWGDGSAHLHMWFLARPYGRLQLRGTFLSLWDSILPPISEAQWRENLALVAAWLAEFGGRPLAEPPRIQWQAPSSLLAQSAAADAAAAAQAASAAAASVIEAAEETPEPAPEPTASADHADGAGAPANDPVGPDSDAGSPADTERTSGPARSASATNEPTGASTAPTPGTPTSGSATSGTPTSDTRAFGTPLSTAPTSGTSASGTSASGVAGTDESAPGGPAVPSGAAFPRDRAGSTDVEAARGAANETARKATPDSATPDSGAAGASPATPAHADGPDTSDVRTAP
ncbi:hypothetical protein ABZU25_07910 [Micromonospora sp. NPDC005215]|uniref:hypothetical protein n=1 Tax=Micromonospora sp. NPDC005215 TaxID=3157024 RepID=UPI0033A0D5A6